MEKARSPLRYPGGKIKLSSFVKQILEKNEIRGTYVEPFAGGAGIAINLLLNNHIDNIVLNDFDLPIYSFWRAVTEFNYEFLALFDETDVNILNWHIQKEIFNFLSEKQPLTSEETILLGFSTYYLNRTNFSGILRGATPIGGLNQTGNWKIDCEYNKERLRPLIEEIGKKSERIYVSDKDMVNDLHKLLPSWIDKKDTLIFIDPPYVDKGRRLYLPIKEVEEHRLLAQKIINEESHWLLTYDAHKELLPMYGSIKKRYLFDLNYTVKSHRVGKEFLALSDSLVLPENPKVKNLTTEIGGNDDKNY